MITKTFKITKAQMQQLASGKPIVIPHGRNILGEILETKIVPPRKK